METSDADLIEPPREIGDALVFIVTELQKRFPMLYHAGYPVIDFRDGRRGFPLKICDPALKAIMWDAYPTGLDGGFAYVRIEEPTLGLYKVIHSFKFGIERNPRIIDDEDILPPRPEVKNIAQRFADSIGMEAGHFELRGTYWYSSMGKKTITDLRQARDEVLENLTKYEQHGRANPAPIRK